jgi:hypothetical protein
VNLLAFPKPQPCHACEHKFVGAVCPTCKTERPSFTALKNITSKQPPRAFERPLGALPVYPVLQGPLQLLAARRMHSRSLTHPPENTCPCAS